VDRREFFWEDQRDFDPPEFFASLLKQAYLDDPYVPAFIPRGRLSSRIASCWSSFFQSDAAQVEIHTPQRGQKKHMIELVNRTRSTARAALPRDEAVVEGIRGRCRNALGFGNVRRGASSASIFPHIQGTARSRAWWCGKTGG